MDRPSSPRTKQLGADVSYIQSRSPVSSPRRLFFPSTKPKATEQAPRLHLVQQQLRRFKECIQESDSPKVYVHRQKYGLPQKSSVDIEPQLRAMDAISHDRLVLDSSSMMGPRPSWEDSRPHVPAPRLVEAEYVVRGQRTSRGRGSSTRTAALAAMGSLRGGSGVRGGAAGGRRRQAASNSLLTDIAELRGPQRLRQYIRARKRGEDAPLQLLTDVADGWDELREKLAQEQDQQQQQRLDGEGSTMTTDTTATTAGLGAVGSITSKALQQLLRSPAPPPRAPVVFVAETDWPVAAAAAGVRPPPPLTSAAPHTLSQAGLHPPASTLSQNTRLQEGPAKPAPTSVVLVQFPYKGDESSPRRSNSLPTISMPPAPLIESSGSSPRPGGQGSHVLRSPSWSVGRGGGGSTEDGGDPAEGNDGRGDGFVPGVERYHTTYTLPSRALSTVADKLSPRGLVNATQLVEVVEVLHPPRLRQRLRHSESSGAVNGGGGEQLWPQPPMARLMRRHSLADPEGWAAGTRSGGGGAAANAVHEGNVVQANRSRRRVPTIPTLQDVRHTTGPSCTGVPKAPVPEERRRPSDDGVVSARGVGGGRGALAAVLRTLNRADGGGGAATPAPPIESFAQAAHMVMQAQRWRRLAASPGTGTLVSPRAFECVAEVAAEAVQARPLRLVPALATSGSQIVVVAAAAAAPPPPPLQTSASVIAAGVPPGPMETKRMRNQAAAQLQQRWSIGARTAAATITGPGAAAAAIGMLPRLGGSDASATPRTSMAGVSSLGILSPEASGSLEEEPTAPTAPRAPRGLQLFAGPRRSYTLMGGGDASAVGSLFGAMDAIPEEAPEGEAGAAAGGDPGADHAEAEAAPGLEEVRQGMDLDPEEPLHVGDSDLATQAAKRQEYRPPDAAAVSEPGAKYDTQPPSAPTPPPGLAPPQLRPTLTRSRSVNFATHSFLRRFGTLPGGDDVTDSSGGSSSTGGVGSHRPTVQLTWSGKANAVVVGLSDGGGGSSTGGGAAVPAAAAGGFVFGGGLRSAQRPATKSASMRRMSRRTLLSDQLRMAATVFAPVGEALFGIAGLAGRQPPDTKAQSKSEAPQRPEEDVKPGALAQGRGSGQERRQGQQEHAEEEQLQAQDTSQGDGHGQGARYSTRKLFDTTATGADLQRMAPQQSYSGGVDFDDVQAGGEDGSPNVGGGAGADPAVITAMAGSYTEVGSSSTIGVKAVDPVGGAKGAGLQAEPSGYGHGYSFGHSYVQGLMTAESSEAPSVSSSVVEGLMRPSVDFSWGGGEVQRTRAQGQLSLDSAGGAMEGAAAVAAAGHVGTMIPGSTVGDSSQLLQRPAGGVPQELPPHPPPPLLPPRTRREQGQDAGTGQEQGQEAGTGQEPAKEREEAGHLARGGGGGSRYDVFQHVSGGEAAVLLPGQSERVEGGLPGRWAAPLGYSAHAHRVGGVETLPSITEAPASAATDEESLAGGEATLPRSAAQGEGTGPRAAAAASPAGLTSTASAAGVAQLDPSDLAAAGYGLGVAGSPRSRRVGRSSNVMVY